MLTEVESEIVVVVAVVLQPWRFESSKSSDRSANFGGSKSDLEFQKLGHETSFARAYTG